MMAINPIVVRKVLRQITRSVSQLNRQLGYKAKTTAVVCIRQNSKKASLFQPAPIKPNPEQVNVGQELCGTLRISDVLKVINVFKTNEKIIELSEQSGLDESLRSVAFKSFEKYCLTTKELPSDLHICISDITQNAGHITNIFPYFMRFVKELYPHLEYMTELKKISDLRCPELWFPAARAINRKIIFHAGPTNSGKTHKALEKFVRAKRGVYCGPLRLLVKEVYQKANKMGTPCDLITGEERLFASGNFAEPSAHTACSVEMLNLKETYDVAIIDEIQMLSDPARGYAWTRALLGANAQEIHLCGEAAAINIVKSICAKVGENVKVYSYKRLTRLIIENEPIMSMNKISRGDCIVCFNKSDIYRVSHELRKNKKLFSVIYGSLPPATKLAEAARFNDPKDPCSILVATNAIGMGLNLHIRRIIFFSLKMPDIKEDGSKEMKPISVSQALQIAGRAGRYGSVYTTGYVTTFTKTDLGLLKYLLNQEPEEITKAGLHPTAEQIELYSYYLPHSSLSNIMDIFLSLSVLNNKQFFICDIENFKYLADLIEHLPLNIRTRYVFACAPIDRKVAYACKMFVKYAKECSKNSRVTANWVRKEIGKKSFDPPQTIMDLTHLESVYDILELYHWLSQRFIDIFCEPELVREMQHDLDKHIQYGVSTIATLLRSRNPDSNIDHVWNTSEAEESKKDATQAAGTILERNTIETSSNGTQVIGKITRRLLDQGLVTDEMLQKLYTEWKEQEQKKKNSRDKDNND